MGKHMIASMLVVAGVVMALPGPVSAQLPAADPFLYRFGASLFLGGGIPVGEFSDADRGNHESGGVNLAFELEFYVLPVLSIGATIGGGVYDDKTFGDDLQTDVTFVGAMARFVVPTATPLSPYVKGAIGSLDIEFDDSSIGPSIEVDSSLGFMLAGGLMVRLSPNFSLNGQVSYVQAGTDGNDIRSIPDAVLNFDTEFVTIDAGISFFFP